MKYFIDTEFEPTPPATMLSFAIVREDGEKAYWEVEGVADKAEFFFPTLFVRDHVLPRLYCRRAGYGPHTCVSDEYFTNTYLYMLVKNLDQIRRYLVEFVGDDEDPQFYAWYGAQDWIFIIQMFEGQFSNLPKNWPGYYHELKVMVNDLNVSKEKLLEAVPKPHDAHFALADAFWNRDVYDLLVETKDVE